VGADRVIASLETLKHGACRMAWSLPRSRTIFLDLFEAAVSAAFSLAYCNPAHYLTNDKQARKWQTSAHSFL
jgi:hypothetical protein